MGAAAAVDRCISPGRPSPTEGVFPPSCPASPASFSLRSIRAELQFSCCAWSLIRLLVHLLASEA